MSMIYEISEHIKSGREFAAWLGLVSRQTGTSERLKLLDISKRGDTYTCARY